MGAPSVQNLANPLHLGAPPGTPSPLAHAMTNAMNPGANPGNASQLQNQLGYSPPPSQGMQVPAPGGMQIPRFGMQPQQGMQVPQQQQGGFGGGSGLSQGSPNMLGRALNN